jgi:lysozyme family protein
MMVFERENPSFDSYLGNGQPLNERTTLVPRGRGPFTGPDAWVKGAVDALTLDNITQVTKWTWPIACYEWEKWNGFGPRSHGCKTGYVWSGTTIYEGGKYIHDGPDGWSPGTWDHQLGCVILARAVSELDPEIGKGFYPDDVASTPVTADAVVASKPPRDTAAFITEIKKLISEWEASA